MNLIEQLGGYERAKRIEKNIYGTGGRLIRYPSKDFDYNDDGGNVCDVELISFKANDLKKSLLEYRRANNIFEVGDKVKAKDDQFGFDELFRVDDFFANDDGINLAVLNDGDCYPISFLEHATDLEIEAGRRI